MASLNRVQVIGNLGQAPEKKFTSTGKSVTSFSVAVNNSWKDAQGNRQQATEWVTCEAWGGVGEFVATYLDKGSSVYLEGRLKTDRYDDKDGNPRSFTKVVVTTLQSLDKREGSAPAQTATASAPSEEEDFLI